MTTHIPEAPLPNRPLLLALKRAADVVLGSAALAVLSPVMGLTALAIKATSPGPAIFAQDRLGLGGRVFRMYKFRTMKVGAEAGGVYETAGDQRVTPVGRFLRRTSLDELPQLVNIVRGDMSIIGPRPTLTYHPWPLDEYTPEQLRRFTVRPGVTGWAQVNGRKSLEWPRRIQYDLEYVDRMSVLFELRILARTAVKVLSMGDNVNISRTAGPQSSSDEAPEAPTS